MVFKILFQNLSLLVAILFFLLSSFSNSFAQTGSPPAAATNDPNTTPFNVQMPPAQSSLPAGVVPMTQSAPINSQVPLALPPSSGGLVNPYNQPIQNSSIVPVEPTKSEIIAFTPKTQTNSVLVVKTSEGEFKVTLKPNIAPKNVENFVDLALGQKEFVDVRTSKKVKRPFYTGLNCHRVVKSVLIQCGCPFGNGTGGPGFSVGDERSTAMKFNRPGVVAMALARVSSKDGQSYEPNSAGSQFFISLAPLPEYNGQFTVIGQITSGMDTIRKIAETPTGPTDRPLKRVIIFSIDPDLPPLAPNTTVDPTAPSTAPLSIPSGFPDGNIDPFALPPPPPPGP